MNGNYSGLYYQGERAINFPIAINGRTITIEIAIRKKQRNIRAIDLQKGKREK